MFIVLEGIDGSGTTTQRDRLAAALTERDHEVLSTCEPSRGRIGTLIREALTGSLQLDDAALALLFAADRVDHIEREIAPALHDGLVVISDRYLMSSLAYQSLASPLDWVRVLNARAPRPDLTFFLRVSPDTAADRRRARGGADERFDAQQLEVAAAYERVLSLDEVGRVVEIDAEPDVETVTADLLERIVAELES